MKVFHTYLTLSYNLCKQMFVDFFPYYLTQKHVAISESIFILSESTRHFHNKDSHKVPGDKMKKLQLSQRCKNVYYIYVFLKIIFGILKSNFMLPVTLFIHVSCFFRLLVCILKSLNMKKTQTEKRKAHNFAEMQIESVNLV